MASSGVLNAKQVIQGAYGLLLENNRHKPELNCSKEPVLSVLKHGLEEPPYTKIWCMEYSQVGLIYSRKNKLWALLVGSPVCFDHEFIGVKTAEDWGKLAGSLAYDYNARRRPVAEPFLADLIAVDPWVQLVHSSPNGYVLNKDVKILNDTGFKNSLLTGMTDNHLFVSSDSRFFPCLKNIINAELIDEHLVGTEDPELSYYSPNIVEYIADGIENALAEQSK